MAKGLRILIVGASGMVGQGVLRECLRDPGVARVCCLGRSPLPVQHAKLDQLTHPDLRDFSGLAGALAGFDACFFCLGASAAGLTEAAYARINFDIPRALAEVLVALHPGMVFVYVSGAGTDSSEKGRIMWARVKGRTENHLMRLPFKGAYMFRPAGIVPVHGERSRTAAYRWLYLLSAPLHGLLYRALPGSVTTTEELGRAMLAVARTGLGAHVLESRDIRALGRV
jgi:uncharacterized protein YbjT (DUF2867 family)